MYALSHLYRKILVKLITRASKNIFSFWSNYHYNLFSKILQKYGDLTEFFCMKIRREPS